MAMREVTKSTPKEGGDGPPSSIKGMKSGKGHKQTGSGKKKSAEGDVRDQQLANAKVDNADPFRQLMEQASRNSRYALPLNTQGTADPNDPSNATPDEHVNMPKKSTQRYS